MSQPLQVDTSELRRAGSAFTSAGNTLAELHPDAPLGDAAAAVPQLRTADACNAAKSTVADEMTVIADAAKTYGSDLSSAADEYDETDRGSGADINRIEVPPPAPR